MLNFGGVIFVSFGSLRSFSGFRRAASNMAASTQISRLNPPLSGRDCSKPHSANARGWCFFFGGGGEEGTGGNAFKNNI